VTQDVIVAHYHEIGLKGKNRSYFEKCLRANMSKALEGTGAGGVASTSGRIIVELGPDADAELAGDRMKKVFGLSHLSPAMKVTADLDAITEAALAMAAKADFKTFEVRAKKGNSSFEGSSQDVNRIVGQAIKDSGKIVDLDDPEWSCYIELVHADAYVYSEKIKGPGGLPVGVSGKVLSLLSGGIDSPVASWEVAKRGASVEFIHFHGQPYSDPTSVQQATALANQLGPFLGRSKLWLIPFGELQAEIVKNAQQELRVVLYRRFMMRIAESLALREGTEALVTGESLGQVASQTLPNIAAINNVVHDLPVLRPLIGRDKLEIERIARDIETYEISIQPHQDCCVLFVPRQVTTRARIPALEAAEADLDVEGLVEKGVANAELVRLS
jgi:thiamine biosynthesis protein ThiI